MRWLIAVVLALSVASAAWGQSTRPVSAATRKPILMHYMPWYETKAVRGAWGTHWTGHERQHDPEKLKPDGLPDIWSHLHPLIGLYDSTEADVLECQLLQMKLAGVDGVIADWYGIAPHFDYPPIHEATKALFTAAGKAGMSFSVCYEDRTVALLVEKGHLKPDEVPAHLTETMRWMDQNWFHADHYFRLEGRPLLLNFGPVHIKDGAMWASALSSVSPRPMFFALHHLWKQVEADGGFKWVHPDAFAGDPTDRDATLAKLRHEYFWNADDPSRQMLASATPGFRCVYAVPFKPIHHRGGDVMRMTLEVAMAGPWPVVQVATWNDYGEGTCVEPTWEFGYTFLEVLQEARRKEQGDAFTFTADDLRLPARLLSLRRAGKAPRAELDRAAALLIDGKTLEARELLKKLAE